MSEMRKANVRDYHRQNPCGARGVSRHRGAFGVGACPAQIETHRKKCVSSRRRDNTMRFAQLFGLLMTTLWASLATAGTVTTSVYAPLTGTVNVTTEVVEVTGFVHVVTRCIPTDPCAIYVNLVRVEGEGQTTGQRYLGLGTASVELVELPPNPIVPLALTFALLPVGSPGVPPNPIQPIEAMRVTLTLEFDPTGVLVAVSALASSAPPPGGE